MVSHRYYKQSEHVSKWLRELLAKGDGGWGDMIRASNPDCNEIDLIQIAVLCNQPPGEIKLTETSRKHQRSSWAGGLWSAGERRACCSTLCIFSVIQEGLQHDSASVTLFMTTVLGLCDQGSISYKDRRDTSPGGEGAFGESICRNTSG